ncbi:LPS-assembly protein LptD [Microvirga pudoricolor]|uniref:LPS-assembly protein LptD n=1 Tax=Microvirga pudoricolor TaxID=2778729 RepID=UPI00194E62B8|nr:LPS-assembly protein LptD [Microvirga pudoricolor]MBM6594316.1 LPS-assembly protein LptD [Microvirga pudoricolor]
MAQGKTTIASSAVAMALFCAVGSVPAGAQTLNDSLRSQSQAKPGQEPDRLLVDAKEIIYDNDKNTVAAAGDVELNYQGRTLQADRVTYDRNTGRVYAQGNARLTDKDGTVATGERFELTDDFKNGFIDSLRVTQSTTDDKGPVTTRFSAPRAERAAGETTTFERGTYTACAACADDPERPPLWQVKAAKIIHNNSEQTIYYEDATMEFYGIPVAYLPYFWTPDPTVKRKTGFLAPRYSMSDSLGYGFSVPFFWALAPNYDLTVTPTYYTRQGLLAQAEWRHRLATGSYNVRAAGISQLDNDAFLDSPLGPGDRRNRGSLETSGLFHLNERWKWGWDITLVSDKWFLTNYGIKSESLSAIYLRESISTLFLQGQGDRSFFDMRGYYFQTLATYDWQKQQPIVAPVIDYDKRINGPAGIGGEIGINVNVTSLTREAAQFQSTTNANARSLFGLYGTCAVFSPENCLVRGIAGNATRASAQLSWRREFIDSAGQVWTPFTYLRADSFWTSPRFTGYQNAALGNFLSSDDDYALRAMPAVGLEYRFPFVADLGSNGTQVLEPIAQIIARPNETRIGDLPNEDAQSLVFDDTSLFDWDKFSGYDRAEGGVRANVGLQYTVKSGDFTANALFGQSYQLAGANSFNKRDLVNTGLDSGLDTDRSDYVGRLRIAPNNNFMVWTRGRFDEQDFSLQRIEAGATANFAPYLPVSASLTYARYEAQPDLGFPRRREGLLSSAQWNITPNWYVTGSVLLDLDRYLEARETFISNYLINPETAYYARKNSTHVSSMSFGLGYMDECTTFTVRYSVTPTDIAISSGEKERNRTIMFTLELRTLGEVAVNQNLGNSTASESGVAN